jgi:hypothetical protein
MPPNLVANPGVLWAEKIVCEYGTNFRGEHFIIGDAPASRHGPVHREVARRLNGGIVIGEKEPSPDGMREDVQLTDLVRGRELRSSQIAEKFVPTGDLSSHHVVATVRGDETLTQTPRKQGKVAKVAAKPMNDQSD